MQVLGINHVLKWVQIVSGKEKIHLPNKGNKWRVIFSFQKRVA